MNPKEQFDSYRETMNQKMMDAPNSKIMKRIFSLDTLTYSEGVLNKKTKEMLGLATSMVLRCDDCIKYHLIQCFKAEVTTEELMEIFAVANVVGGTIVIPHTRRALEFWETLETK